MSADDVLPSEEFDDSSEDDDAMPNEEIDDDATDSENISNTSESEFSEASDYEDLVDMTKCDDITKFNGEDFSEYDQELLTKVYMNNFEDMIDEGMIYKSEDAARDAYNDYARKIGFSIRSGNAYKRADGSVRCRIFVCYKEGHRKPDRRNKNVRQRKRPEVRTGCKARILIKPEEDGDWVVSAIFREHNHTLVTPRKSHMLPSHRKLKDAHTGEINSLDAAGIQPVDGYDYMVEQAGGHANVGFTYIDYKNYLRKKRLATFGKGDAATILSYFTRKKSENSNFFYAVMVDEENQLTNLFWADATSIIDYSHFGDVIVFDTTYRTNRNGRPFAPFIGVNHHRESVIFGGALLVDERTQSFVWLFETFLRAMSGKKPKTILTDQCPAMAKAISIVFPETQHRLCLWHIFQNAAKHLSHVYQIEGFKKQFNSCIYGCETEEEFLARWKRMLEEYELVENEW